MMMNMKQVELHFQRYTVGTDPLSIELFMSNVKNHYLNECFSHKQLLRFLSSLGLLGNLQETINNFKIAIVALIENPSRDGNYFIIGVGSNFYNFCRYTLYAVSNTFTEIVDSLFNGLNSLINHSSSSKAIGENKDNSLDIEQEFLDNINSIAGVLDTQNKIWLNSFVVDEVHAQNFNIGNNQYLQEDENNVLGAIEEANILERINSKSKRERIIEKITSIRGNTVRIKQIPVAILYALYQFIKKINHKVKMDKGIDDDKRIRNPRYFGYTKELEDFSYKKALAIQILPIDDITDIFTFERTEMILTEKMLLCISQEDKIENLDYWTLKYSDILSVKVRKIN